MANDLSLKENIIILCGHYKGVDQRVRDHLITREISVGDFVLTGGELPAAIIADAVVRVVPGVIGDEQSALSDWERGEDKAMGNGPGDGTHAETETGFVERLSAEEG